jgi:hypothetical protein
MKHIYSITLLFFALNSFSQEEVQWFQPGQEWYYNVYCFQSFFCGATHYEVENTEMIGGEAAVILNKTITGEFQEPIYGQEYFRFEDDTVWRYSPEAEEWHMLYDMGAEVGDVWTIQEEVYYGYSDGEEPEDIPLFKVVVDSVAFWETISDSPLTNRRVIFTRPVEEPEMSYYTFGQPIVEGIGPVGGAHDLIGNTVGVALPLQSPSFHCFISEGQFAYGSSASPCFTLSTEDIDEVNSGLIYPNPATGTIFWSDESVNEISIYNSLGQLVMHSQLQNGENTLSVKILESGVYVVVIKADETIFSQKLILK